MRPRDPLFDDSAAVIGIYQPVFGILHSFALLMFSALANLANHLFIKIRTPAPRAIASN
jgi:hypothetical protein